MTKKSDDDAIDALLSISLDENFDEEEEKALNSLPVSPEGLAALLRYIDQYDSFNAYETLFKRYQPLMSPEVYSEVLAKTRETFIPEAFYLLTGIDPEDE